MCVDARGPTRTERTASWRLTADLVRAVNPGSGTAVLFESGRDAALVAAAHERFGVLLRARRRR